MEYNGNHSFRWEKLSLDCLRWLVVIIFIALVSSSPGRAESLNSSYYDAYTVDYNVVIPNLPPILVPRQLTYLVPKRSILLLHGDIITPVNFMPDLPAYALTNSPTPQLVTADLPIPTADLNAENIMDHLVAPVTAITPATSVELFSGDFDGDGRSDLLVSDGTQVYIVAEGSGGSSLLAVFTPPAGYQITGVTDRNSDGLADILMAVSGESYVFSNNSGGEFVAENDSSNMDTSLVGSIAGQFRVNEQGAATYSIPIMTFAGTAGVAPQISLNYSSQGGSGIAGVGWSIGGVSAITRCRQTESQDGNVTPLSFDASDRFCLDGQRLMLTSGTYGSAGSTYRTEIDSYVEVTAKNGTAGHPDHFEVTRKDGSTSYYGQTANAKRLAGGSTLTWGINQFQDSAENPIKFQYLNDADGFRIRYIYYAFGTAKTNSTTDTYITFNYGSRPDVSSSYINGSKLSQKVRLTSIETRNDDQVLRNYQLKYLGLLPTNTPQVEYINADKSYIQQIAECVGTQCLKPTHFNWNAKHGNSIAAAANFNYTYLFENQSDRVASWKPIDINGDGIGDLVWVVGDYDDDGHVHDNFIYSMLGKDGGAGYDDPTLTYQKKLNHSDNPRPMPIQVIDYNADGRQDVAFWDYSSWKILLSKVQPGGGWALEDTSASIDTGITYESAVFADVDSDGLVDVLYGNSVRYLDEDPNSTLPETGYSFGSAHTLTLSDPDPIYATLSNIAPIEGRFGDADGDGRNEILFRINGDFGLGAVWHQHYLYRIDENHNLIRVPTELDTAYGSSISSMPDSTRLIDINGDGFSDGFYSEVGGDYRSWKYAINGSNTGIVTFGSIHEDVTPQFVDYNRDGFTDIAWHDIQNSEFKVREWNPDTETFAAAQTIRSTDGDVDTSPLLMDLNGDGAVDYVVAMGSEIKVYLGQLLDVDGTLASIDNGMGNQTIIEYERLNTASDHYAALDERIEHQETTTTWTYCNSGGISFSVPYNLNLPNCSTGDITSANADQYYTALNSDWGFDLAGINTKYNVTSQFEPKQSPVLEFAAPINLVTRVSSSAPVSGNHNAKSHISYFYTEAKIQAKGRGLLGFRTISTQDEQSDIITTTRYRQDFPFIGSPLYTSVMAPANTTSGYQLVKESFNDYGFAAFTDSNVNTKRYQVWARNIIETSYDLNGVETSHTKTTSDQPDAWGNTTGTTVSTYSAADHSNYLTQVETDNLYTGGVDGQRYGRLSSSTVVHRRAGATPITKQSSFTYYTSNDAKRNLLETETVAADPVAGANGQTAPAITTTYEYDAALGYKTKATVSVAGETSRFTEWIYTADGRYLTETKNSLGHSTEKIITRNEYGAPTQIDGLNGYSATVQTDLLGREYHRTDSTGAWQQTTYSTSGLISGAQYQITTDVAGGGTSTEYFDALGRSMAKTSIGFDGLTVWSQTEYDSSGRVLRQSIPYRIGETILWSTNAYDDLGRPTSQTLPDTTVTSFSYNGLQTTVTNALLQTKTETRNAAGELIQVEDALNGLVQYSYRADGQLKNTSVIADGNTITTVLEYNNRGQKTKMFDPDKGTWFYQYNGFGELSDQYKVTSVVQYAGDLPSLANSQYQRTHMDYDVLGRMTQRDDYLENNILEGTATWTYDHAATNGIGKLRTETGGGLTKTYIYGAYTATPRTDLVAYSGTGIVAVMSTTYDSIGRVYEQTDAVHFGSGTRNIYNSYGYLDTVQDLETGNTVYDIVDTDARGNITEAILQDGVTVQRSYNPATGRLNTIDASTGLNQVVQDLDYSWDDIGNLLSRDDGHNSQAQSFCYDALNRLTKTHNSLSGSCSLTAVQQDQEYDGFGNITRKSGVGSYNYSTNMNLRPHAVVSTTDGIAYHYDNNGNMTFDYGDTNANGVWDGGEIKQREFTYASFDKPTQITKGDNQIDFNYDASRSRWKRVDTDTSVSPSQVVTTYYLGNVEKVVSSTGTRFKRNIAGVAIWTHDATGTLTKQHTLYKDALGSVVATRDVSTGVLTPIAFDPWGQRVMAANLSDVVDGAQMTPFLDLFAAVTTRGFTGHEMLDAVGVVHMNGRIYDARLGRFLQADPFVDGVFNTQGYNRYSYGKNSPLNGADPSGYGFVQWGLGKIARATGQDWIVQLTNVVSCAASMGNPFVCGAAVASSTYGYTGDVGASLKAGAIAGISVAAFQGIANGIEGSTWATADGLASSWFNYGADVALNSTGFTALVAAQALAGGVMAELQGGKFGHGFASAGLSKVSGAAIGGWDSGFSAGRLDIGQVVVAAIVGGTSSKLTGGKFANGAVTGALLNMYNQQRLGAQKRTCSGRPCISRPQGEGNELYKDLYRSLKENLKFGTTVKAAAGSGAGSSSIFTIDGIAKGDSTLTVDYVRGAIIEAGFFVRGDVYSSGEIEGFYQSGEICAIGCIRAAWDYQGNFNIGTRIVFPFALGGSISGGYTTSGRELLDKITKQ